MIVQFRVRLTLIDEIKRAQDSDPALVKLKDMVKAGQETKFEIHQGILKLNGRLCVPNVDGLRQRILQEAHCAPYSVHPEATKMYHDIKDTYWWDGLKKDVAEFVASCLTCQQVKIEKSKAHRITAGDTTARVEVGPGHHGLCSGTAPNTERV